MNINNNVTRHIQIKPKIEIKENPFVSIILTLYEIKKEYLQTCLDTILNQTYQNIEIIAIDDCSPTQNYEWITELSDKIKLYRNEVNLGMNKTVNKAFSLANGDYIVRLGSDDYYSPVLIEKEVNYLRTHLMKGAVCCELLRFGKTYQYINRPLVWDLKNIIRKKQYAGTGYAGGMMFKRELLEKCSIDESFGMCEDFDFHLQILEHTGIGSINEPLYFYRSHETNICKNFTREERYAILDRIIEKHSKVLTKDKIKYDRLM